MFFFDDSSHTCPARGSGVSGHVRYLTTCHVGSSHSVETAREARRVTVGQSRLGRHPTRGPVFTIVSKIRETLF